MKKNIDISEIDHLAFIGTGDKNIMTIQENVDSQIVIRGNTIHLNILYPGIHEFTGYRFFNISLKVKEGLEPSRRRLPPHTFSCALQN